MQSNAGAAPPWAGPVAPPWGVLSLLPNQFADWYKNYYAYAGSILPIAASGAAVAVNIALQNDAFFVLLAATMEETAVGDLTVLAYRPLAVTIFDTSASANLFNQAIMADEFFGDAASPGFLAYPYIFTPGGNIQLSFTNFEAVQRNVRFTLHGFKCNPRLSMDAVYEEIAMSGRG